MNSGHHTFSVRCVLKWPKQHSSKKQHTYEERITLWKSSNIDEAIRLAEQEAMIYMDSKSRKCVILLQAFELYDELGEFLNGIEVFSLIRDSDLPPSKYRRRHFATGHEHERVSQ